MTSNGAFAPLRTALDLRAHALAILVPGATLDVSAGDAARAAVSLLFLAFLSWPIVVTAVAGAWLVFVKAGRPGWACLVPGYNLAQFLLLAKLPRRSWVLLLVPGVNIVLLVVACARLARAFRKGPGFAAGLVLLPPVYMTILGMSRARYRRFEVLPEETRKHIASEALGEHEERRKASTNLLQFPGVKGVASGSGPRRTRPAAIVRLHALEGREDAHPPARAVTRAARSRASPPLHLV